jgi:HEAT repeat protein
LILLLSFVGRAGGGSLAESATDTAGCQTVPACVEQARKVADPSSGITPAEQAVAEALRSLGPDAIDPVMDLLRDPDPDVRELAGFVLRGMGGLAPGHLSELERAVEEGNGWLPPAIASIGTPRAVAFLVEQLVKEPESETQVTFALQKLGAKALPDLLDLFRCQTDCDERLLTTVGRLLGEEGETAAPAVDPLVKLASGKAISPIARRCAVRALGFLERTAAPAVEALVEIAQEGPPDLREEARRAVVAIGGPGTRRLLEDALAKAEVKTFALADIASLHARGREMGPAVERYLRSAEPDERVAAAEALGMIGYRPAVPALVDALEDRDDWRLVYVAAKALGLLHATDAVSILGAIADDHWYPPVREAARETIRSLRQQPNPGPQADSASIGELYGYESASRAVKPCADRTQYPARPQPPTVLDPNLEPDLAEQLSHEREAVGSDEHGRHVARRRTVPQVGLRIGAGWLIGTNAGEWGGELVLRSDDGQTKMVLGRNLTALHSLEDGRLVAVTGLAHMGLSEGAAYLVECASTRDCTATRWKQLPGAPQSSWITNESGELLVNTTGGSLLISLDGRIRMAECVSSEIGRLHGVKAGRVAAQGASDVRP